jgi:hypothetical protein
MVKYQKKDEDYSQMQKEAALGKEDKLKELTM